MQGGFFSRHVAIVRNEKNIAARKLKFPLHCGISPTYFLFASKFNKVVFLSFETDIMIKRLDRIRLSSKGL